MAVTGAALAARHFLTPKALRASRRVYGGVRNGPMSHGVEGASSPEVGCRLRHERSRWFARVNELAQLGRVAVVT
jgi:hypothetical protein